jgi:hypothetical protein
MAEFQWWLLLLGLVAGGGIVAAVYLDGARRDQDIDDRELPAEATWIGERLAARGQAIDAAAIERVLLEHRAYRLEPPPDRLETILDATADAGTPDAKVPGPVATPGTEATPERSMPEASAVGDVAPAAEPGDTSIDGASPARRARRRGNRAEDRTVDS